MQLRDYIESCGSCPKKLSPIELDKGCCGDCGYEFNPAHRRWAQKAPEIYWQEITLPDGTTTKVLHMAERMLMGEIIKTFGLFAVTTLGIECLSHSYLIENIRIPDEDWHSHMSEKSWINVDDFSNALAFAKSRLNQ